MTFTREEVAAVAGKLTEAQRRAVVQGKYGYNDDNTLDGPGRGILYRLIERGLFEHPSGPHSGYRPDIAITSLGLAVRDYLRGEQP